MKLFYSPGASSLAPHIILRHCGLSCELMRVNLRKGELSDGSSYLQINPLGAVPALQLDDGEVLTECAVILQYLADQAKDPHLMPAAGTRAHYHQLSWLNFIATEIHKGFSTLFNPHMPEEAKTIARSKLSERLDYLNRQLAHQTYLINDDFTTADAYLFTALRWCEHCGVPLKQWPALEHYRERLAALPAVVSAMQEEGLSQ